MKYHVFTRDNAGDDLIHAGMVTADSDRLARIYAHRTYDEEDWEFMGIVREDNLIEVNEQPIAGGETR